MSLNMKKRMCCLLLLLGLAMGLWQAAALYKGENYMYSDTGKSVYAPAAYAIADVLDGSKIGCGLFSSPQDLFVSPDNRLYIADKGNNRVVVLNPDYSLDTVIETYVDETGEVAFSGPTGVFVSGDGILYVCESEKGRVLMLDGSGRLIRTLGRPDTDLLDKDIIFRPVKVVADNIGTIYVACTGIYQGMVTYDMSGAFTGFYGASKIELTGAVLANLFWKSLFSQEQAKAMTRIIPTEYSNVFMDNKNFIYATSLSTENSLDELKKLNALGENILYYPQNSGFYPKNNYGDIEKRVVKSQTTDSRIVDVQVDPDGFISLLDAENGRVFQYDQESDLLAVFGNNGERKGTFKQAVSLEKWEGRYWILDAEKGTLTAMQTTRYGDMLRTAVGFYARGEYRASTELWENILKSNSNLSIAYKSIGKALCQQGQYEEALPYFKKSNDRGGYSEALRIVRKEFVRKNLVWLLAAAVVAGCGIKWLIGLIRKRAGFEAGKAKQKKETM